MEYFITPYFRFDFPRSLCPSPSCHHESRSQPHNSLDIIIPRRRHHTQQHNSALLKQSSWFIPSVLMTLLTPPRLSQNTTDNNSEQAAACKSSSSSSGDAPLSRKQQQQRHGIKNKSVKKTSVSKQRPHTHDERDALKKPGTAITYRRGELWFN